MDLLNRCAYCTSKTVLSAANGLFFVGRRQIPLAYTNVLNGLHVQLDRSGSFLSDESHVRQYSYVFGSGVVDDVNNGADSREESPQATSIIIVPNV